VRGHGSERNLFPPTQVHETLTVGNRTPGHEYNRSSQPMLGLVPS
jgi:hypothetical protein